MPMTVEEFKKAFKKSIDEAEERAEGTSVDSTELDAAKEELENAWAKADVDKWPARARKTVQALRLQVGLGLGSNAKTAALAKVATGQIEDLAKERKHALAVKNQSKPKKSDKTSLDDTFPTETHGTGRHAELLEEATSIRSDSKLLPPLWESGDWRKLIAVGTPIAMRLKQLRKDIALQEFRADCSLVMNQGDWKRPGQEEALLDQLDSQGICQAMVLDFLGKGGTGNEPGDLQEGQITSTHVMTQSMGTLNGVIGANLAEALEKQAQQAERRAVQSRQQVTTDEEAIARLEEQRLEAASAISLESEAQLAATSAISRLEAELRRRRDFVLQLVQKVPASQPDKDGMVASAGELADQTEASLKGWREYARTSAANQLAWEQHAVRLDTQKLALEEKRDGALESARKTLADARGLRQDAGKLRAEAKRLLDCPDMVGKELPSAMLEAFGVELVEGSLQTVEPAGELLTDAEVLGLVQRALNGLDAGVPTGMQISVKYAGGAGHAIGLHATAPAEGGSWDIEFLDPNQNAYRFTDRSRFETFLPTFYETIGADWAHMGINRFQASGRGGEGPGVSGPSVEQTWNADWPVVTSTYEETLKLPRLSKVVLDEVRDAMKKIASLFPVDDPKTGTEADLLLAQGYVGRLLSLCKQISEKNAFIQPVWREVLEGSDDWDEETERSMTLCAAAFDGGDLDGARKHVVAARKALAAARKKGPSASGYTPPEGLRQVVPDTWSPEKVETNELFGQLLDVHKDLFDGAPPTDLAGVTFAVLDGPDVGFEYVKAQVWDENENGPFSKSNPDHMVMAREMAPAAVTIVPGKDPDRTIYINQDYFERDGGKPNYDEVNAVMLHESHHAASKGFVNVPFFSDDHSASWKLDECATDWFTKKVWDAKYADKADAYFLYTNYFKDPGAKKGWYGETTQKILSMVSEKDLAAAYFSGDTEALVRLQDKATEILQLVKKL